MFKRILFASVVPAVALGGIALAQTANAQVITPGTISATATGDTSPGGTWAGTCKNVLDPTSADIAINGKDGFNASDTPTALETLPLTESPTAFYFNSTSTLPTVTFASTNSDVSWSVTSASITYTTAYGGSPTTLPLSTSDYTISGGVLTPQPALETELASDGVTSVITGSGYTGTYTFNVSVRATASNGSTATETLTENSPSTPCLAGNVGEIDLSVTKPIYTSPTGTVVVKKSEIPTLSHGSAQYWAPTREKVYYTVKDASAAIAAGDQFMFTIVGPNFHGQHGYVPVSAGLNTAYYEGLAPHHGYTVFYTLVGPEVNGVEPTTPIAGSVHAYVQEGSGSQAEDLPYSGYVYFVSDTHYGSK